MLNNSQVIEEIFRIAIYVTENEVDKLRIEEELLWLLLKTKKHSLNIKTLGLQRLERIQKAQLELMGQCLKKR